MRFLKFDKLIKLFVIFIFSSITFSTFASGLKGVKEIQIIIEDLDHVVKQCGITEALLDSSIRLILSNSRLRISNKPTSSSLVARAVALEISNFCTVHIKLEFYRFSPDLLDTGIFWNTAGLFLWNKNDIQNKISSDLERYTKEFIAEWLKANSN